MGISKQKAFFQFCIEMTAEVEKKAVDLGKLEKDDEFEEFPTKGWNGKTDEDDVNVWEDNWDDDAIEDDFSVQLITYSRKRPHSHSPPLRSPEPIAKKHCSRPTPPASPARGRRAPANSTPNGVTNGHSNGDSTNGRNGNDEAASTGGRRSNSRRNNAASRDREPSESSEEPRTTRSSARLRSSRK